MRESEPERGFTTGVGTECQVTWTLSPYVKAHGWTPAGTQWVIATIKPSTSRVGHYREKYFRAP